MRIYLLLLLGAAILVSFHKKNKHIAPFNWLKGEWQMQRKSGAIIEENWEVNDDSTLSGKSFYTSSAGQTKVSEILSLAFRNGSYYYISTVLDQNAKQAIGFRINSYSDKGFVAENPEHDFPKRITYTLVNKDSIHAFIDGGAAMPDKRVDFYYSRQN